MPDSSDTFDCDDGTLLMCRRFTELGIQSIPLVGNLDKSGEKINEVNHVWVQVAFAGRAIAFDWGVPHFDRQHYEGYAITYDQLIEFVRQDEAQPAFPSASGQNAK